MKSQNVTFADGFFIIVCPHCSKGLSLAEQQTSQINGQLYPCPQEACGKEIEFPTQEEVRKIMAKGEAPVPEPATPSLPAGAAPAPPQQANPAAKPTPPPQANPAAKPTPPPETNPEAEPTSPSPETPKQEAPGNETSSEKAEDEIVVGFGGGSTATLEREAAGLHKLSVKTILHSDCVTGDKDTFDDVVSKFLSSLEEENLVGVHPVQYTADEKKGSDFGVMILYKTIPQED